MAEVFGTCNASRELKKLKTVAKNLYSKWDESKKYSDRKNMERDYLEGLHLIWSNVEAIATRKREMERERENVIDTDECKKHLDRKRTERDYLEGLRLIQSNAETIATHKRQTERENVVDTDAEANLDLDDTDGEADLQYEHFLANLKEQDKCNTLEVEINGVNSLLAYGEEFSSDDASELEGRKRKRNSPELIDVLSNQKLGVLNNTERVNQRGNPAIQCSRNLMDLSVGENVDRRENELSTRKPDTDWLLQKQVKSRKVVKRKNVDEAPLAGKEKTQRKDLKKFAKGKNVGNGDHEVNRKAVTLENENHLNQESSASNRVKVVPGKNVDEANGKVVVQIGNQLFYRKPGFGNNGPKENHKGKALADNQKARVSGKKLKGILKRENVISGANRKGGVPIDYDHFEQDRPVKEEAVKSRVKLKKVVKEKKVVKVKNIFPAQETAKRTRGTEKKQLDNNVQVRSCRQSIRSKLLCKNLYENVRENEDDDGVSSDVEILDKPALNNEGITNLVTKEDIAHLYRANEYAKELMSILKKPYDNREYKRLSEDAKVYHKPYPGLKKKLTKYRYKPEKRLNILRGFFYWLRCCRVEGAFRPWEHKECLAVEPGCN